MRDLIFTILTFFAKSWPHMFVPSHFQRESVENLSVFYCKRNSCLVRCFFFLGKAKKWANSFSITQKSVSNEGGGLLDKSFSQGRKEIHGIDFPWTYVNISLYCVCMQRGFCNREKNYSNSLCNLLSCLGNTLFFFFLCVCKGVVFPQKRGFWLGDRNAKFLSWSLSH